MSKLHFGADRAEITGAKERSNVARQVVVVKYLEPGEAEIGRQFPAVEAAFPIVEHRGVVGNFLGDAADDIVHPDRFSEEQAQMKKPHLESRPLLRPQ